VFQSKLSLSRLESSPCNNFYTIIKNVTQLSQKYIKQLRKARERKTITVAHIPRDTTVVLVSKDRKATKYKHMECDFEIGKKNIPFLISQFARY